MSKKILAVIIVLVLIIAGGQSAFWFFKTSQLEKNLVKYLGKKDIFFSVDKFEISGFPLQQNVSVQNLTIKIPESFTKNSKLTFETITLSASIFSNNFNIKIPGNTILKDNDGKNNKVKFNQAPTANLSTNSSGIESFNYSDKGYVIFGEDKKPIAKSGANSVQFTVSENESGQIISRIKSSSKDTENFNLTKFYKNNYENSIIDGIKTGKIQIGMKELEQDQKAEEKQVNIGEFNEEFSPEKLNENFNQKMAEKNIKAITSETFSDASNDSIKSPQTLTGDNEEVVKSIEEVEQNPKSLEIADQQELKTDLESELTDQGRKDKLDRLIEKELADLEVEKEEKEVVKNDIIIDIEYILTPLESNSQQTSDPTKIVQIITNYDKSYRINQFTISSDDFRININGQLNQPRDDTNMSGFITLKVDMISNFIDFVKSAFKEISSENDTKIQSFDQSYNSAIVKNAYSSFLTVVSEKLEDITHEIAAKNQLSQNEEIVLEIRREKNLDIVINETPIREIVGKF